MKQKIIYIAGLGHSGSTILDLALGAHPDIAGLGEVYTILDENKRMNHFSSLCSCGEKATDCLFWKNIPGLLANSSNIEQQYEILIKTFRKTFGNEVTLVDSSKNSYGYLKFLNENYDLKVLFLTRDVRSWIYSRHLNTGKPLLWLALRWYLENKKLLYRIRKMNIKYKPVGYEELSIYPELLLPIISEYLELEYDTAMLHPDTSKSHIISGNIARVDPQKRDRFMYDARWLLSFRLYLISPLLGFFMKWNNKFVYSHLTKEKMKTFYLFGTERRKKFTDAFN